MLEVDKGKFVRVLATLCEYYRRELSPPVIEIYWRSLSLYEVDAVQRAADVHMMDSDKGSFFPMVSDFVRAIEGASGDQALRAWSEFHEAIKMIGPYQSVVFDDPLIHVVVSEMGGWIQFCDVKTDDMPFRAKEFCTRYRSHTQARKIPPYSPKLIGIIEADCNARGFIKHIPLPMLVGDAAKAQFVLTNGTARAGALKFRQADSDTSMKKLGDSIALPGPKERQ